DTGPVHVAEHINAIDVAKHVHADDAIDVADCLNADDIDVADKHHLAGVAQPGPANSLVTR
ncbi:MAG: hypothetical protein WAL12_00805, partial [Trebonia sp.]